MEIITIIIAFLLGFFISMIICTRSCARYMDQNAHDISEIWKRGMDDQSVMYNEALKRAWEYRAQEETTPATSG